MKFAEQLREAMGDMTQERLAELSGVDQTTISKYLRGVNVPNLHRLDALEAALPRLREIRVGVGHAS